MEKIKKIIEEMLKESQKMHDDSYEIIDSNYWVGYQNALDTLLKNIKRLETSKIKETWWEDKWE